MNNFNTHQANNYEDMYPKKEILTEHQFHKSEMKNKRKKKKTLKKPPSGLIPHKLTETIP